MRITQNGNSLIITHITGPTHNYLAFTVDTSGVAGSSPFFVLDEPNDGWPFDAVKCAVLEGIAAAGGPGMTCIRSIRLIGSDTPTVDIYHSLALRLARHLNGLLHASPVQEAVG